MHRSEVIKQNFPPEINTIREFEGKNESGKILFPGCYGPAVKIPRCPRLFLRPCPAICQFEWCSGYQMHLPRRRSRVQIRPDASCPVTKLRIGTAMAGGTYSLARRINPPAVSSVLRYGVA
jgi:hypothetical protein